MNNRGNLISARVAERISEIKEACPDAVLDVSYQPYETEDANIRVRCPDDWTLDQCDALSWQMADKYTDTLLNDGISIVILIIEPPEQVRRENESFQAELDKQAS